jgi:hypothetical protein
MDYKTRIAMWIAWRLPPRVLLWAVVRGSVMAMDKFKIESPNDISYKNIHDAISLHYQPSDK